MFFFYGYRCIFHPVCSAQKKLLRGIQRYSNVRNTRITYPSIQIPRQREVNTRTRAVFHPFIKRPTNNSEMSTIKSVKFSFATQRLPIPSIVRRSPVTMPEYLATKAEFDACVRQNPAVIVDYTASWCGPCKMIAPLRCHASPPAWLVLITL